MRREGILGFLQSCGECDVRCQILLPPDLSAFSKEIAISFTLWYCHSRILRKSAKKWSGAVVSGTSSSKPIRDNQELLVLPQGGVVGGSLGNYPFFQSVSFIKSNSMYLL